MIANYHVRARTSYRSQDLQNRRLFVYPSLSSSSLHHSEFSTYIIGSCRHPEPPLGPVDNIQICKSRFDHNHISTLFDVQGNFAKSLFRVMIIHLVCSPVTELGRGESSFSEGSEEGRSVLRRIGENAHIFETIIVECFPDRFHLPVDHRRRRDDISSRPCMAHGYFPQVLESLVILDVSIANNPAVAMAGVLAHANVSENGQLVAELILQTLYGLLHNSLWIVSRGP